MNNGSACCGFRGKITNENICRIFIYNRMAIIDGFIEEKDL